MATTTIWDMERERETQRWHEIAEIFNNLTDEFKTRSRGACAEEDCLSFLYT